jgi:hypothetical protein
LSDSAQFEKLLTGAVEEFEKFSGQFIMAMEHSSHKGRANWYTPKELCLRLLKACALATSNEVRVASVAVHGAIACLGFSGTVKLIFDLRRKHIASTTKGNKTESSLPGV